MILMKPRGRGRCLVSIEMILKKKLAKRGAWQTFSLWLKTQGHCHQAAYIFMLSRPVFCSNLALKLLYMYLSNTSIAVQAF